MHPLNSVISHAIDESSFMTDSALLNEGGAAIVDISEAAVSNAWL
jgi:hypothetical protein